MAASYRCQLVSEEEVTMTLARSRRMLLVAAGHYRDNVIVDAKLVS